MGNNINVNYGNFRSNIDSFKYEQSRNYIYKKAQLFDKSEGDVFNCINSCLTGYNDYCQNLNLLYNATSIYLDKACNNIKSCEESC